MTASERAGLWIGASLGVALVLWLAGPRPRVEVPSLADSLPSQLQGRALADYIAARERAKTLRPNTEKKIVWANPEQPEKTPLSIIYLHGFSATRMETAPLSDSVAAALGANLFYTRLAGHGESDEAFGEAEAGDWLADAAEAYHIASRIGERVVIIGTSTGATLATWLAAHPERFPHIAAHVVMSPNYGVRGATSAVLTWPWGEAITRVVAGDTRSWEPANEAQAAYWHTSYPTRSLIPMMALVDHVNGIDAQRVKVPTLMIYSEEDQVVDTQFGRERVGQFAGPTEFFRVGETSSPSKHVLAGDIVAPEGTEPIAEAIVEFVRRQI